jgi:SNF2 family DNA or RNA helicase
LKSEVDLILPQKNIINVKLELTHEHRNIYDVFYTDTRNYIVGDGSHQTQSFSNILAKIMRLLQVSNHPNNGFSKEEISLGNGYSEDIETIKFEYINQLINNIPIDQKIVIFSRWNTSLELLAQYIKRKNPLIQSRDIITYNGSMSRLNKNEAIKKFKTQTQSRILLANIIAGGCGLNLVEAQHLVLLEPSWTSAIEQQAIDRIHRIGQKNIVHIYQLHTHNTIEEWIYTLKEQKKELATQFDENIKYDINKKLLRTILQKFITHKH